MSGNQTTAVVQRNLGAPPEDAPADPHFRALPARALGRLELSCGTMPFPCYHGLTQPPLGLQAEERLRAPLAVRPRTVGLYFALAGRYMCWGLNDLVRRSDEEPARPELREDPAPAPPSGGSALTTGGHRTPVVTDSLPADERDRSTWCGSRG